MMHSSERVLRGNDAEPHPRSGANGAGATPGEPLVQGSVLRGVRSRPGGGGTQSVSSHRDAATATREGAARTGKPVSPGSEELRHLHDIAEERGYRAGMARAERDLTKVVVAAGAIAAQLEADAPTHRKTLAAWVAELSLAIAHRILGDAVAADPALLVTAVERAISAVESSPDVRILLHPNAVDRVRDAWEAAHGVGYLGKRWTFGADPAMPVTGCLVRYQHGLVEAGIDAQLEGISSALRMAIGGDDPVIEMEPVA